MSEPKRNTRPRSNTDPEARKWARLNKLGTNSPICLNCGETDDRCLERHHIAGRKYSDFVGILCSSCHDKLSDKQKDHPPIGSTEPTELECIGRLLLGLANFFEVLATELIRFGHYLINLATGGDFPAQENKP
jgi:hypothetical protein